MIRLLCRILPAAVLAVCAAAAMAQAFPSRPITIVVPFPAGGALDAVARPLADEMRKELGQPVIIDNRAGAGGTVGSQFVSRAGADGYTILLGSVATHAIAAGLYPKLGYDPVSGFSPLTQLTRSPLVLVVGPRLAVANVSELVKVVQGRPGAINYGSTGNGTALHIAGELFKSATAIKAQHVPYRGGGQATVAMLAGEVDYMFANVQLVLSQVRSGKLRALGVTGPKRLAALADVPTLAQAGVAGIDLTTWFGLFAPPGTPADIVARLNEAAVRALAVASVRQQIIAMGEEPVGSPAAEFAEFVRSEHKRWVDVVQASGIKID